MGSSTRAVGLAAFFTLMLIALMMGANHVAARLAFSGGMDVATGVAVRSWVTAAVVAGVVWWAKVPWRADAGQRKGLLMVGLAIGFQSQCLYSSVARLPVALALLGFNTYPLWTALWDRVLYGRRTERAVLQAMPVILLGLALALDVSGASSGLGAIDQWQQMGVGVAFALGAAAVFGLALVWTQHETQGMDGRVRTIGSMVLSGMVALTVIAGQGGPHWPHTALGWVGLAALTFLYGTAFTIMFTVLPKLGVSGHSALMNVEPVFALGLAWVVLDQRIAPIQIVGALLVVGAVIALGLRQHGTIRPQ
ncbi:MAG: DMT family transporter [Betaproteobacteria bacterium]|nr:DMT family transporter [Betaproteobacteria bacterium]NBY05550.1 DMT family transporter [Betaproteobacteria bacterium]